MDTRWAIVLLTVGAGVIAAGHVGKAPPALPQIRAELDLGLVAGGWVISVFSATGVVMGLAAGSLADRVGHRLFLLIGLALMMAGSLAGSFAASGTLLLATRVIEGLGYIVIAVSAPSLIAAASASRDRRFALGIWGAYMPLGSSAMMLISPLILGTLGWRGLWQVMAALTLVWVLVMLIGTRAPPAPAHDAPPPTSWARNVRLTLSRPGPWLLAASFALYTVAFTSLFSWLPTFLVEQRGLGIGAAATLTAFVVAINAPGNLLAGWLLRHGWSHWSLLALSGAIMGVTLLGIFATTLPDGLRYALCLGFSGFGGMLPTAALAAAPTFAPSPAQVGTMNGVLVQGANTGMFFGPPAIAAVVAATGQWESVVWVMVAASAAIVVLAFAVRRIEQA